MASRITLEKAGPVQSATSILKGLKIGIPQVGFFCARCCMTCPKFFFVRKEYFPSELSPQIIEHVRSVLTMLKANGANIVPVSMPSTSYALSSYYVLASAEASSNMARYDGIQYGMVFSFLTFPLTFSISYLRFLCQTSSRHDAWENIKCICTNS
jgi:Asp-tRNA(Asn)/Glu-tRNA(Gln) amidotransferase A subunit family amidase